MRIFLRNGTRQPVPKNYFFKKLPVLKKTVIFVTLMRVRVRREYGTTNLLLTI